MSDARLDATNERERAEVLTEQEFSNEVELLRCVFDPEAGPHSAIVAAEGGLRIAASHEAFRSRCADLERALEQVSGVQPKTLARIRDHGYVFETPLSRPSDTCTPAELWEKLAFSIYTDLCEADSIARAALEEARECANTQALAAAPTREEECGSLFPGGHGETRWCIREKGHDGSHDYGAAPSGGVTLEESRRIEAVARLMGIREHPGAPSTEWLNEQVSAVLVLLRGERAGGAEPGEER